jgi:four helix bundle protein
MEHSATEMKRRTKAFALATLRFISAQPHTEILRNIHRQLIRAATSVGANYRAACRSRSRAEFIARIGIALEEADESAFWLEFLIEFQMNKSTVASNLLDEANQLSAIFAASALTAKANSER